MLCAQDSQLELRVKDVSGKTSHLEKAAFSKDHKTCFLEDFVFRNSKIAAIQKTWIKINDQKQPISINREGVASHYSYDDAGNLISYTNPDGITISYGKDIHSSDGTIYYTFRPTQEGYIERNEITDTELIRCFDSAGSLIREVYPDGHSVEFSYKDGEVIKISFPEGEFYVGNALVSEYMMGTFTSEPLDSLRNPISGVVDSRNQLLKYRDIECKYDGSGNLVEKSKPYSRLSYDPLGRLIQISTAKGAIEFTYDSEGRRISKRVSLEGMSYTDHLIYYGKRYYDPSLRRWISPDPNGRLQVANPYDFVLQQPQKYIDVDGDSFVFAIPLAGAATLSAPAIIGTLLGSYVVFKGITKTAAFLKELNKKRNAPPAPDSAAGGRPHTIIEKPGKEGQYTTHYGDGTYKQYRGSGKPHGNVERPNIKENKLNQSPDGPVPGGPRERKAEPREIPGNG